MKIKEKEMWGFYRLESLQEGIRIFQDYRKNWKANNNLFCYIHCSNLLIHLLLEIEDTLQTVKMCDEIVSSYVDYSFEAKNLRLFHYLLSNTYGLWGAALNQMGKYKLAQENIRKSIRSKKSILKQDPELLILFPSIKKNIALDYFEMGTTYLRSGRYEYALLSYKLAAIRFQEKLGINSSFVAKALHAIGLTYWYSKDLEKSEVFFQRAFSIRKEQKVKRKRDIAESYNDIGMHLWLTAKMENNDYGLLKKGELFMNKAIETLIELPDENRPYFFYANCINDLGMIYEDVGRLEDAENFYLKALRLKRKQYNHHPDIARNLNNLGLLCQEQGRNEDALFYYQEAMIAVVKQFREKNLRKNPKIKASLKGSENLKFGNIDSILPLFYTLEKKSKTFYQLYEKKRQEENLKTAYDTILEAVALLRMTRSNEPGRSIKTFLAMKYHSILDFAMKLAYTMWQLARNKGDVEEEKTVIHEMMSLIDNGRSLLLSEAVELRAKGTIGNYRSLFLETHTIRMANLKKQLSEIEEYLLSKNKLYCEEWMVSLELYLENTHDLDDLYGVESNSISEEQQITLSKFQKELQKEVAVVVYYLSKDSLYTLIILDESVNVVRILGDETSIQNLIQKIDRFKANLNTSLRGFDKTAYIRDAHELYQIVMQPIEKRFSRFVTRFYIIAHEYLQFIPFELLLVESTDLTCSYNKLPYLLNEYDVVSYHYSLSLLYKSVPPIKPVKRRCLFIGFVPETGELYASKKSEVESIAKILIQLKSDGEFETIFGAEANLQKWKASQFDHYFVHLASHMSATDEGVPGILLSKKGDSAYLLTLDEVSRKKINSDIVILNCCGTGDGEIQKGEGVIAHSSFFVGSGAENVIFTFINIPHEDSKQMMISFYENVIKGNLTYAKALRAAKKAIMKKEGSMPQSWGGFAFAGGQMRRLQFK